MKKSKLALYPGSFDPMTNGHVDIVHRALSVFDQVLLVVASSSRKSSLLTAEERVKLAKQIFQKEKRVSVEKWDGLIMDFARQKKAQAVIRGLRAASDFEYEFMMASMNKDLNADVETFFMMTGKNLYFVSSSMIKELVHFGADISPFVPPEVCQVLQSRKSKKIGKSK